jgi:hypothetical protein
MTPSQPRGKPALLWGSIFGIVLFGIMYFVSLFILTFGHNIGIYFLFSLVAGLMISLTGGFFAAFLAGL